MEQKKGKRAVILALAAIALTSAAPAALGDPLADFYATKQIVIDVGFAPGGGYDAVARLLSRYLGRHMPGNPSIIVRNAPGAGGLLSANSLYNIAPRDGSEFAVLGDSVPFSPLWSSEGVQYDANRFNYLGGLDRRQSGIAMVWSTSPVKTIEDAKKIAVKVGSTGAGDLSEIAARVFNAFVGTKFETIAGYRGFTEGALAMERGEIDGWLGYCWPCLQREKASWVTEHKINVLAQFSSERNPELKDAPTVFELVHDAGDKQVVKLIFNSQEMSRLVAAPPGIPPDRLDALRAGFEATVHDPAFLAEAQQLKILLSPANAAAVEALVRESYAMSPAVLQRTKEIVNGK